MNELEKEKMLDLLIAQATGDLSAQEAKELHELEKAFPELKDDDSFELAAASFSIANLDTSEPMPDGLQAKILDDAGKFFASETEETKTEEFQKTFAFEAPKRSALQWLGWAFAGLACIALAINVWTTRNQTQAPQIVYVKETPTPTPSVPQQLEQFLATAKEILRSDWSEFNPKEPRNVKGEVVWSNPEQEGFLRVRGLPVNDKSKEQYQLWIFDESQKKPVDGGVFDVNQDGEVIIPINPKLKIQTPKMFAITAEKPGGVPVSELGKVMTVAKVEIPSV